MWEEQKLLTSEPQISFRLTTGFVEGYVSDSC